MFCCMSDVCLSNLTEKRNSLSLDRASPSSSLFGRRSSISSEKTFSNSMLLGRRSSVQSERPFSYINFGGRRSSVTSDSPLFSYSKQRLYPAMPGRIFICVKNFQPTDEAELRLRKGDFVEGYYPMKFLHLVKDCCVRQNKISGDLLLW